MAAGPSPMPLSAAMDPMRLQRAATTSNAAAKPAFTSPPAVQRLEPRQCTLAVGHNGDAGLRVDSALVRAASDCALASGVRPGDRIESVDGAPLNGKNLDELLLLKAKVGFVTLVIMRNAESAVAAPPQPQPSRPLGRSQSSSLRKELPEGFPPTSPEPSGLALTRSMSDVPMAGMRTSATPLDRVGGLEAGAPRILPEMNLHRL